MPPRPVHLLLPAATLAGVAIACGAYSTQEPTVATFDLTCVTCQACLGKTAYGPPRGHKRPVAPRMTEKQFQAQVVARLQAGGWTYYHTWDARRSPAGFPDLVAIRRQGGPDGVARCVVAELKIPPRQPTAAQTHWLDLWRQVPGVTCYVWTPDEWPQIEEVFR